MLFNIFIAFLLIFCYNVIGVVVMLWYESYVRVIRDNVAMVIGIMCWPIMIISGVLALIKGKFSNASYKK